jgi:hypothetical protein
MVYTNYIFQYISRRTCQGKSFNSMDLAQQLLTVRPRERGGEVAQRGFDFQSCWAASYILEYELKGDNYVFLFEYHDDIVVLNDEISPSIANFIQVKVSENDWTLARLINQNKSNPVSTVGKLFMHKQNFNGHSIELTFITNAYFKFDRRTVIFGNELKDKDQAQIISKIKEQISSDITSELKDLKFVKTDLSMDDHSVHLVGKVNEFLEQYFSNGHKINSKALSEILVNECRKKSKLKSSNIKTFNELIQKKGIEKNFVTETLQNINNSASNEPNWVGACELFKTVGKSVIELIRAKAAFHSVAMKLNNSASMELKFLNAVKEKYDSEQASIDYAALLAKSISTVNTQEPELDILFNQLQKECLFVYATLLIEADISVAP